jgi:hypothetical protein
MASKKTGNLGGINKTLEDRVDRNEKLQKHLFRKGMGSGLLLGGLVSLCLTIGSLDRYMHSSDFQQYHRAEYFEAQYRNAIDAGELNRQAVKYAYVAPAETLQTDALRLYKEWKTITSSEEYRMELERRLGYTTLIMFQIISLGFLTVTAFAASAGTRHDV